MSGQKLRNSSNMGHMPQQCSAWLVPLFCKMVMIDSLTLTVLNSLCRVNLVTHRQGWSLPEFLALITLLWNVIEDESSLINIFTDRTILLHI